MFEHGGSARPVARVGYVTAALLVGAILVGGAVGAAVALVLYLPGVLAADGPPRLVSFGLLGTLLAAAAFYYPLLAAGRRPPLLLAQYVMLSLSFLVESTLETPVGLAFAVVFVGLAGQEKPKYDLKSQS